MTNTTVDPSATPKATAKKRRLLIYVLPTAIIVAGAYFWLTGGRYVETDNAYIHQPMIPISADVSGRVAQVMIRENEKITEGTAIFAVDDEPYQIALSRAEAALAAARLAVLEMRARYATAKAQLDAAQSILTVQERELERQKQLTKRGVVTEAVLDSATVATLAARNSVDVANAQLNAAAASLAGDPNIETDAIPAVKAAIAARDAAARDLKKTQVLAPAAGTVSQLESLNVGQFIAAGAPIATLVNAQDTWIEANFKETEIEHMSVGQPVEITIDAYPNVALHGTVESFGSATGSQFSLIPAQNATGNWVKVVQRIAVRVKIDGTPDVALLDGMSARVSVDTGLTHLDRLK